jgi:hypothetical protein
MQEIGKKTYYVKSDYYTEKYIDTLFDSTRWKKVSTTELTSYIANKTPIDYIYLDGKHYYNPINFKLTAHVKNLVGDEKRTITSKNKLMDNLSKLPAARKFIMPQLEIDLYKLYTNTRFRMQELSKLNKVFNTKKVFIFKPVSGFAGQGIQIVTSMNKLQSYINIIIKENSKAWNKSKKIEGAEKLRIWVLQEYLTDPLLINLSAQHGRKPGAYKFHIRHYLFYVPGKTSYYVYEGEIAPARAPYIQGNWGNKLIHDTHFYGRDGELFPAALGLSDKQVSNIYKQIDELYSHILTCINAKCYSESSACYELFGVDLMITHDYKVKVIEVNEKLGMPSSLTPMSQILFEGCLEKIVMPLLGITDHTIQKYDKHFIAVNLQNDVKPILKSKKSDILNNKVTHSVKNTVRNLLTKTKKQKLLHLHPA